MIIGSLVNYYDKLIEDGEDVPMVGYANQSVKYILDINEGGDLVDIVVNTYFETGYKGKETEVAKKLVVPFAGVKTSGIKTNFLCDDMRYMLGYQLNQDKSEIVPAGRHFENSKNHHLELLSNIESKVATAVTNFFINWEVEKPENCELIKKRIDIDKEFASSKLVFRLEETLELAHTNKEIKNSWDNLKTQSEREKYFCLITGKFEPLARKYTTIKGLKSGTEFLIFDYGDATKGTSAFSSYLKPKISEFTEFKYTAVISKLLSSKSNKFNIGDTRMIFWSDNNNYMSESTMSEVFGVNNASEDEDLKGVLEKLTKGIPLLNFTEDDFKSDFYIVGIVPTNKARAAIRFFMKNNFGLFLENIKLHTERFEIEGPPDKKVYLTPWELSQEAVNKNAKEKNDDVIVSILKAILTNDHYPTSFISKILTRMKAELHGDENTAKYAINYRRVGMIKAYLLKQTNYPKEEITVALNNEFNEPAYLLGRLFATYEKIQEDDGGNVNIKSNYFASASVTPASIFPNIVKSGELYLGKLQGGLKITREKLIGEIMSLLPAAPLPKNLSFEEQNLFVLGYYHQRQDFFTKKDNVVEAKENE